MYVHLNIKLQIWEKTHVFVFQHTTTHVRIRKQTYARIFSHATTYACIFKHTSTLNKDLKGIRIM